MLLHFVHLHFFFRSCLWLCLTLNRKLHQQFAKHLTKWAVWHVSIQHSATMFGKHFPYNWKMFDWNIWQILSETFGKCLTNICNKHFSCQLFFLKYLTNIYKDNNISESGSSIEKLLQEMALIYFRFCTFPVLVRICAAEMFS